MSETSQESSLSGAADAVPSMDAEMSQASPVFKWQVIGKSVCGASHIRAGLPNQDAIAWEPKSVSASHLILAVSDGHGSSRSFRSHIGAGFAVQASLEECRSLLEPQHETPILSDLKLIASERLPQRITRKWTQLVEKHIAENPVSSEELEKAIKGATTPINEASLNANKLLWYGATLASVVVTDTFIIYFQVGDGEILIVSEAGEVQRPIPTDERLLGNETTSLCSKDAWRDFRIVFQAHSKPPPALIMLSTDGYINSFTDAEAFLKVGPDFMKLIKTAGLNAVNNKLAEWLAEASQNGSGDDITLGIISRL